MKKLKLPPSVLNGTPLTESEMKEILGGMQLYRHCSCRLYYTDGAMYEEAIPVGTEEECNTQCSSHCDATAGSSTSGPKCRYNEYYYVSMSS